jgi:DNA-binding beta-propeller fold protein YncE
MNGDGLPGTETDLFLPQDVTAGPGGELFIADWNNHAIRVLREGVVDTVVGVAGVLGDAREGPARERALHHPTHVAILTDGSLIVSAWHNYHVLHYDPGLDEVTRLAGSGEPGFNGDGLPATETHIDMPVAAVPLPSGAIAFSDQINQRVRMIDHDGVITTLAGTGEQGYAGDGGPAANARFNFPAGAERVPAGRIDIDAAGAIYLADTNNHVIRRIESGLIETLAGTGQAGDGGSGLALESALHGPTDVAVGPDDSIYIADTFNSCIRRVAPDGTIATVAGRCGERGHEGDGGPADEALLNRPYGIDVSADGTLYIADTHNHVIRAVRLEE